MPLLPVHCNESSDWIITSNEIGSGFEGTTYQACRKPECNYVAKKVLTTFFNDKEYNIMKMASTNGISPKLHDLFRDKEYTYIIMDKMDKTLEKRVDELGDNYEKIYELYYGAVEKINKFHELGYSHNDIKSENIMVNKDDEVFIIDYGSAEKSSEGFETDFRGLFYDLSIVHPEIVKYVKKKLIEDNIFEDELLNTWIPEDD